MMSRAKNDLVNRYIKDGKDQSDFFRGFIVSLEHVLLTKESFRAIDEAKKIVDNGPKGVR